MSCCTDHVLHRRCVQYAFQQLIEPGIREKDTRQQAQVCLGWLCQITNWPCAGLSAGILECGSRVKV